MKRLIFLILTVASIAAHGQNDVYTKLLRLGFNPIVSTPIDTTNCKANFTIFANNTSGKIRVWYGCVKYTIWPSEGSGGGGTWGTITGTLSDQTDLQAALDGKQPIDSDLTTIAGLTPSNDDFLQFKSSAWANRTVAQVKSDLGLSGTNTGDQTITLTGDVTGSGTGSFATTLATVNSNVGSFGTATQVPQITVNAKGLITAASNVTITPAVGSITGLGTGVATALGVNVGSAGAVVVNGGALGTPSSGTATNLTGTAASLNVGTAATLTTARNIQGVSFNGSANIDIINGTGFVKATGTTLSYDNSTYLSAATAASTYLPISNPAYTGTLSTGTLGFSDTDILASVQKSVNSYAQVIFQNTNSGATASTDLVIAGDNATASTHYLNLGRNSSGFTGSGSLNGAGYGYLTNTSEDLVIGTTTAHSLRFLTNSSTTDNITISGAGLLTFTNNVPGNSVTGTWTASANNQTHLTFGGTGTTRSNASDVFDMYSINPTINVSTSNAQFTSMLNIKGTYVGGNSSDITRGLLVNTNFDTGDASLITALASTGNALIDIIAQSGSGTSTLALRAGSSANTGVTSQRGFIQRSNGTNGALEISNSGTGSIIISPNGAPRLIVQSGGNTFIGANSTATAVLHLAAGTTAASSAPLKINSGALNTTAEAGTMEYNDTHYQTKGSGLRYALGGPIADFTSDVSNSGTGETDLYTYTTPASTLASTGGKLTFEFSGTNNDITATTQLKVYFAGTAIGDTGALTISATGAWSVTGMIIRTGSSTARAIVRLNTTGASTSVYTAETDLTGLTFTNTNILKITGTAGGAGGSSSDITAKLGSISWFGAANN